MGDFALVPKSRTAACDSVARCRGTEFGKGILTTTSFPFSIVMINALLNPPSILSMLDTGDWMEGKEETSLQSSLTLKAAYRLEIWYSSSMRNRLIIGVGEKLFT